MVPAQDFIPTAEDTGLIIPIGEWVLRTACQQNKAWQEEGLPPIVIAINLSGQQFKQRNIGDLVKNVLNETNLDPKYIELELTESIIMDNTELYIKAMHVLKEIGIGLVIDDFGTGYSSLSYLKRFPVDKIKIDKNFVAGLPKNNDDAAIVRAILAMAHQLNLKVVAEGIESKKHLIFLQDHACGIGQGFVFSKAIPPEDFAKLLKENHRFLEPQNFPQKKDVGYVSHGWL